MNTIKQWIIIILVLIWFDIWVTGFLVSILEKLHSSSLKETE